jgi:hypothetical protein
LGTAAEDGKGNDRRGNQAAPTRHPSHRDAIRHRAAANFEGVLRLILDRIKWGAVVVDRDNIIDRRDLQDAAEKLSGLAGELKVRPGVTQAAVVGFPARRSTRSP